MAFEERAADRLAAFLDGELAVLVRENARDICELRLRSEQVALLRRMDGSEQAGPRISREALRATASRMMEDSLYAREEELRRGYFTMRGGVRVGICGSVSAREGCVRAIGDISSLCVRIPRQILGCGEKLWRGMPKGMLILSPPAMGKTTLARDMIRIASNAGYNVAVADERRELAACTEGVPQFDLGCRTDVMDNCPKHIAIPMLVRACAPDMIVADEIGDARDAEVLLDARRCGVQVVATAHAWSIDAARRRFPNLVGRVFARLVLLGPQVGRIAQVWECVEDAPCKAMLPERTCSGEED